MDVDAKNLNAWRFGDILAFKGSNTKIMFIARNRTETFSSINLCGFVKQVSGEVVDYRSAEAWTRVEKAP